MALYYEFNKYYDNGTESRQLVTINLHFTISKKCNQTTTHAILSAICHSHMFKETVKSEV